MKWLNSFMLGAALLAGACSMTTVGQLTEAEKEAMTPALHVFAARQDYNRVLQVVGTYASQPTCTAQVVVACADTEVLQFVFPIMSEADEVLDTAESLVMAGFVEMSDVAGKVTMSRTAVAKVTAYLVAKEIVN